MSLKKWIKPSLLLLGCISTNVVAENLLQVLDLAQQNDTELKQAQSKREQADTLRPMALSALLPQVNLSADLGANHRDGDKTGTDSYGSSSVKLNMSQALYDRSALKMLDQVKYREQTADAELAQAEDDLYLRVAERYFSVLAAQDSLVFARAERSSIAEQLEEAEQRLDIHMISITDVLEIRAAYDIAETRVLAAQINLDSMLRAMEETIGFAPVTLAPLKEDIPLDPNLATETDSWLQMALQNNPSIKAAQSEINSAREQIEVESGGYYPDVSLIATHSYTDGEPSTSTNDELESSFIGVRVDLPLFTGRRVSTEVKSAEIAMNGAMLQEERLRRALVKSVKDSVFSVKVSISQVKAFRKAVASMDKSLEATNRGYELGARTIIDVLNAQRELFRAKRDYAQANYAYVMNMLQLKYVAGIIEETDFQRVNSWLKSDNEIELAYR